MAASAVPPGVVDPTRLGKYPIILSDALLGKSPKDILTAIKYNHKPTLSSEIAPTNAKLKSSSSSSSSSNASYDLSFNDDGGKYSYSGSRSTKENQYVLIFDPERKAFVLHRVDSTFNMNLTRTPSNTDADALKEEYPHLDSSIRVSLDKKGGSGGGGGGGAARGGKGKGSAARNAGMVESKRGGNSGGGSAASKAKAAAEPARDEKKKKKTTTTEVAAKPKRDRSPEGSEDEYSDDDGGLLVEYPDPQPSAATSSFNRPHQQQQQQQKQQQQSSAEAPTGIRRFSEFMANQTADDESDEDADAEYDEEDLLVEDEAGDSSAGDGFKLPSPVGRSIGAQNASAGHDGDADAEGEDDNVPEDDELMAMLEEEMGEGGGMDVDSESSVSEED